jgi:hypothetical protein
MPLLRREALCYIPGVVAAGPVPVPVTAKEHGAVLATRDARARGTYDAVGVEVIVVT